MLAEWIKQVGAFELREIAQFDAVTTFDGDSLWQSQAIPPIMEYGHASATLELNQVSMDNLNKPKRLTKLSYEYCAQRRDFLSMATPWRWPRGSPALQSLVRRIRPMVRKDGTWAGGTSFLVIMHTAWDTYNNWGLRSAFNRPQTHSIVPWFAWSGPLAPGTANHPKWGMEVIRTCNAVCVNGMWQTSATDDGPNARDRKAWGEGSLVRVLVDTTLSRCRFAAPSSVEKAFTNVEVLGVLMRKCSTFFTTEEKVGLVRVHKRFGAEWPCALMACRSVVFLKRLAFAKSAGEMMDSVGLELAVKYNVIAFTLKTLDNFSMDKVVERPAPSIFTDTKVTALALRQIGASQALDCDADRCLRCFMRASQGSIVAGAIAKLVLTLHSWAR